MIDHFPITRERGSSSMDFIKDRLVPASVRQPEIGAHCRIPEVTIQICIIISDALSRERRRGGPEKTNEICKSWRVLGENIVSAPLIHVGGARGDRCARRIAACFGNAFPSTQRSCYEGIIRGTRATRVGKAWKKKTTKTRPRLSAASLTNTVRAFCA